MAVKRNKYRPFWAIKVIFDKNRETRSHSFMRVSQLNMKYVELNNELLNAQYSIFIKYLYFKEEQMTAITYSYIKK